MVGSFARRGIGVHKHEAQLSRAQVRRMHWENFGKMLFTHFLSAAAAAERGKRSGNGTLNEHSISQWRIPSSVTTFLFLELTADSCAVSAYETVCASAHTVPLNFVVKRKKERACGRVGQRSIKILFHQK